MKMEDFQDCGKVRNLFCATMTSFLYMYGNQTGKLVLCKKYRYPISRFVQDPSLSLSRLLVESSAFVANPRHTGQVGQVRSHPLDIRSRHVLCCARKVQRSQTLESRQRLKSALQTEIQSLGLFLAPKAYSEVSQASKPCNLLKDSTRLGTDLGFVVSVHKNRDGKRFEGAANPGLSTNDPGGQNLFRRDVDQTRAGFKGRLDHGASETAAQHCDALERSKVSRQGFEGQVAKVVDGEFLERGDSLQAGSKSVITESTPNLDTL